MAGHWPKGAREINGENGPIRGSTARRLGKAAGWNSGGNRAGHWRNHVRIQSAQEGAERVMRKNSAETCPPAAII
jgi:hypothetical protein